MFDRRRTVVVTQRRAQKKMIPISAGSRGGQENSRERFGLLLTEKRLAKYWLEQHFVSHDEKHKIERRLASFGKEIRELRKKRRDLRRSRGPVGECVRS